MYIKRLRQLQPDAFKKAGGGVMDKQRKRAISRGKFDRVRSMELDYDYDWDNAVWIKNGLCVAHAGFFYWSDLDGDKVQYFRKSISEALK